MRGDLGTCARTLDHQRLRAIALGRQREQVVGAGKPCGRMSRRDFSQSHARVALLIELRQETHYASCPRSLRASCFERGVELFGALEKRGWIDIA